MVASEGPNSTTTSSAPYYYKCARTAFRARREARARRCAQVSECGTAAIGSDCARCDVDPPLPVSVYSTTTTSAPYVYSAATFDFALRLAVSVWARYLVVTVWARAFRAAELSDVVLFLVRRAFEIELRAEYARVGAALKAARATCSDRFQQGCGDAIARSGSSEGSNHGEQWQAASGRRCARLPRERRDAAPQGSAGGRFAVLGDSLESPQAPAGGCSDGLVEGAASRGGTIANARTSRSGAPGRDLSLPDAVDGLPAVFGEAREVLADPCGPRGGVLVDGRSSNGESKLGSLTPRTGAAAGRSSAAADDVAIHRGAGESKAHKSDAIGAADTKKRDANGGRVRKAEGGEAGWRTEVWSPYKLAERSTFTSGGSRATGLTTRGGLLGGRLDDAHVPALLARGSDCRDRSTRRRNDRAGRRDPAGGGLSTSPTDRDSVGGLVSGSGVRAHGRAPHGSAVDARPAHCGEPQGAGPPRVGGIADRPPLRGGAAADDVTVHDGVLADRPASSGSRTRAHGVATRGGVSANGLDVVRAPAPSTRGTGTRDLLPPATAAAPLEGRRARARGARAGRRAPARPLPVLEGARVPTYPERPRLGVGRARDSDAQARSDARARGGAARPSVGKTVEPMSEPFNSVADEKPNSAVSVLREGFFSLRSSKSRFGVFLRSFLSLAAHDAQRQKKKVKNPRPGEGGGHPRATPPRAGGLFPCRPPLLAPLSPKPKSSRRAARWARRRAVFDHVRLAIAASSFLSNGMSPRIPQAGFRPCTSAAHLAMVASVTDRVTAYIRLSKRVHVSEGSGRKGPLLADALANVSALASGGAPLHGDPLPSCCCTGTGLKFRSNCAVAMRPLVASRLAYPDRAGTWNLSRHLYGPTKKAYDDPSSILLDDPPFVPQAKVLGSKREWQAFLAKADAGEGISLLREDEVPRGLKSSGDPITAGFFAVAKSPSEDRTITNRIPMNSQERSLGLCGNLLAHGTCFADVVLRPDEDLRISLFDMPSCYHRAKVTFDRVRTNAVGGLRSTADFGDGFAFRELEMRCRRDGVAVPRRVFAAFRSLPMGDLNAVDFVQVAHINMLARKQVVDPTTLIRYRGSFPDVPVAAGVVVDDLAIVARVPRRHERSSVVAPGPDDAVIQAALAAYDADGVPPKPEKTVLRQRACTVWGASVDGSSGRVGAGLELDFRTQLLIHRLLASGVATRDTWDAVVGHVSYVFLYRRELFCILEKVYGQGRHCEHDEVFRFSQQSRVELELALAFAPLAAHSMRAPVSDRVWATDASQFKAAAVFTDVAPGGGERLWSHRAKRRRSRHLLTSCEQVCAQLGVGYSSDPDDDDEVHVQKWTDEFAASRSWKPAFVYRTDPLEHINLKEARAVRTLARRLASSASDHGKRHLALTDSGVGLGAFTKGRSPSNALNRILRSTVGDRVLADVVIGLGHVSTKWNPGDDPTRGVDVRKRRVYPPPEVLERFLSGSPVSRAELERFFGDDVPIPSAVFGPELA